MLASRRRIHGGKSDTQQPEVLVSHLCRTFWCELTIRVGTKHLRTSGSSLDSKEQKDDGRDEHDEVVFRSFDRSFEGLSCWVSMLRC